MRSRFSTTLADNSTPASSIAWARRHFRRCDWWRWAGRAWAGRNSIAGENLAAMQFLSSAWQLSESGTVANRLGQVLEKQGQRDKARHMYALAVAAGGSVVADSRERLGKLAADPAAADKEVTEAKTELAQLRTVKLSAITTKKASAAVQSGFRWFASSRARRICRRATKPCARPASKYGRRTFRCAFRMLRRSKLCGGGSCAARLRAAPLSLLPIE